MRKIQAAVWQETRKIAIGTAALICLMLAVFAVIGRLDLSVLLGAALGFACAVGNFFLMALSVQRAAEKMNGVHLSEPSEDEDEKAPQPPEVRRAKKQMQLSYVGRLALITIVAILAVKLPYFNSISTLLCLLFPRIVIYIISMIASRKG